MKLKKIASLMLAGVMAVSMLAACGSNGTENGGASSEEEKPSTGYADVFNAELTARAQERVTFTDSTALDAVVDEAIGAINSNTILGSLNYNTVQRIQTAVGGSFIPMLNDLDDELDLLPGFPYDGATLNGTMNAVAVTPGELDEPDTIAAVYAFDGTKVDVKSALKQIAQNMSASISGLDNEQQNHLNTQLVYNLHYTGEISVRSKTYENSIADVTITFVVVTISRTATV
ncbi:hypothetical protein B5G28_07920 [Faecalibacterium sp. An77]|uniref:hypothetical protein n=1 Tax=Faecalibacterium sp. An77 TaxID=1965655 RepID=UPI000B36A855|nr:hypothetical protein [Faecalibacterium sp. An77]OUN38786.1 hypothetical protein B5G28_07920 [Faecalibacterium sp. An77]